MSSRSRWRRPRPTHRPSTYPAPENLEARLVLSTIRPILSIYHAPPRHPSGSTLGPNGILPLDFGSPTPIGYTPQQIRTAYGIDNILFGNLQGDGTGQTIAIVNAYDDPAFVDSVVNGQTNPAFAASDLAQFDQTFGLPDPPSFMKYNQTGQTTNLPGTDPAGAGNLNGTWEMETALDIEWAHSIAPGASIDLVEANGDTNNSDLFTAVATAAALPGVSAVSMSWGTDEYSGQLAVDSTFTTPHGHQGVTFVAASGDSGSPGYYPAYSPNVLSAGGTTLNLNADDTYQSETAWSGSGGGTSQFEAEPAYQKAVQSTGFRTIPDVAWDADPNTGVAVYDSWDDTDNSGPWLEIGGTSVAAPSWAGLIAIANQGRVAAGGSTLDGATETLPALYSLPAGDFHDITVGSNGGFKAGPGYDEVTGLGTPRADRLVPDLLAYGTANHLVIADQPPGNVIAGDGFGVVVSAEDAEGGLDPQYSGTVSISLTSNPGGSTLGGTLTATASHGVAVFDGLSLNKPGTGYILKITSTTFPAVATAAFNVIANPTPGSGTYYPTGSDGSLRAAINAADGNAYASNTIVLSAGTYALTNATLGQIVLQNTSSLSNKSLTIVGAGETSTVIRPSSYPWLDRIFEVIGGGPNSLSVTFQDLSIEGGNATGGGILGGVAALGGALLVDGGTVWMTRVALSNNQAQGARGADGAAGAAGQAGGGGGNAGDARGGGIYLAAGTLGLNNDQLSNNSALGGTGGSGGDAGNQFGGKSAVSKTGAAGGAGGNGGTAAGGAVYVAGGTLLVSGDTFATNHAAGGMGGMGGKAGDGILGKPGGNGGNGGQGGAADGGAIYLAQGSLTLNLSTFRADTASGGGGGAGGAGGPGSSLMVTTSAGFTLSNGTIFGTGTSLGSKLFHGGPGGNGGLGGDGAGGSGGGLYVAGGTLTLFGVTSSQDRAIGGAGGTGGRGGTAGMGSLGGLLGTLTSGTFPLGGSGGSGGQGGSGFGGGLYLAGGTVTFLDNTLGGDVAHGGAGGAGGQGGSGGFAGGLSSIGGGTTTAIGGGIVSGGAGGAGSDGGQAEGGAIYVGGGTLTLINATVAGDSVQGGTGGIGGPGGKGGSNSLGNGAPGVGGLPGDAHGGGAYVAGGTVSLFNSTVALNTQTGGGSGGGVVQVAGTVAAYSTLFAGNGAVNYSGKITANNSLFQAAPPSGTITGAGNLIGINPLLAAAGLASNGGPTQTIALQAGSPAINAGSNPKNLFTDQRGDSPRGGAGTTDIGAYQHNATADTTPPTATLNAPAVTAANAVALNPYSFTVTYTDNTAIAGSSLAGAVVYVSLPGGGAPITASVTSTTTTGSTDAAGDAHGFVVTYRITPPGGSWSVADDGTYTITLGGTPITDLAGNALAAGTLGTFSVNVAANQASATFLKQDTTTQGTWNHTYGNQGYNAIGYTTSNPSYPSYALVTPSGQTSYSWSSSTTDPRALQNPANPSGSRMADAWYSTNGSSFTVDVDLTDGQSHDIELYLLDWPNVGRSESIQLSNATTGAVLNTQTISSFSGGVYLQWQISGNVLITITKLTGPNSVLSGLFFDPTPTPTPTTTATFLKQDTTTQGTWIHTYGAQGYDVIGSSTSVSIPSYATVTPAGELTWTWASSTTDTRALQVAGGASRIAAAWYATTSFTVDVDLTDGQQHDLELYFLDWDKQGRSEQVQITNAATGAVLSTQTVSSFQSGIYLDYAISGNVLITITKVAGTNAVLSGLFLDSPPGPSATFLKQDTTTQGTWIHTYGAQGYDVIGSSTSVSIPSYATVTPAGELTWTWASSTTDTRALQVAGGASRIAAAWYATTSFTVDVDLTDGQQHDLELYFLDWDKQGRSEQVQITNAATGAVLSTQTVSSFQSGIYLDYAISGNVLITITKVAGTNAVLSGLFLDPAISGASSAAVATSSNQAVNGTMYQATAGVRPAIDPLAFATTVAGVQGTTSPAPSSGGPGDNGSGTAGTGSIAGTGAGPTTTNAGNPASPYPDLNTPHGPSGRGHILSHPTRLAGHATRPAYHKPRPTALPARLDLRNHPLVRRNLGWP